jgi:hypothetical protein
MKRILLITALSVAGTMSVSAQPYRQAPSPQVDRRDDRDYDGTDYFERERAPYQRFDRTRWHRDFRSRWVTLANGYAANTTRQNLPLRGQTFDRLRIEGVRGNPVITQVQIIYTNGTIQKIDLDARFPVGAGEVLRLNASPIQRIVINTDPRSGGAYSLHGAHGRTWNRVGRR